MIPCQATHPRRPYKGVHPPGALLNKKKMFSECGKHHDCVLKTPDACFVLDLPALSAQNVKYGDASILRTNTEHFKLFSVRAYTPNTF